MIKERFEKEDRAKILLKQMQNCRFDIRLLRGKIKDEEIWRAHLSTRNDEESKERMQESARKTTDLAEKIQRGEEMFENLRQERNKISNR